MGWSYGRIRHSAKEELRRMVEDERYVVKEPGVDPFGPEAKFGGSPYRLVDVAIVAMREAYMAVLDTRDGKIRAWVYLVNLREGKDGFNFGYKSQDESMLPYSFRCPKRILEALSPVEECYGAGSSREYARQWREACAARLAGAGGRPGPLKTGDRVRFAEPLKFQDGETRDTFQVVVETGRRGRGRVVRFVGEDGARCKITGYRDRKFERVS